MDNNIPEEEMEGKGRGDRSEKERKEEGENERERGGESILRRTSREGIETGITLNERWIERDREKG